jgi:hypothetical protein
LLFFGGFAPTLFYAVSGVTSTFQAKRSTFVSIAVFYIMFAFLGLTFPGLLNAHFWQEIVPWNILQVIAVGAIAVAAIEIYWQPKKSLYLVLAIATFALHYLLTRILNYHPPVFLKFLFDTEQWLPIFFTGVFAYSVKNRINLILGLSQLGFIAVLEIAQVDLKYTDKVNISASYFILSQALVFLAFYLFRANQPMAQNKLLVYFGKNSLLFLYIHFIILLKFNGMDFHQAYIVWGLTVILTFLVMRLCQHLNQYIEKYFDNAAIWIVAIALICILPVIFMHQPKYVVWGEMLLGLVFACNYHILSQLVKKRLSVRNSIGSVMSE